MADHDLARVAATIAVAGAQANAAAQSHIFAGFRTLKAPHTLRRHAADLALFADFLRATAGINIPCAADGTTVLALEAEAWRGITHGLIRAFQLWQLNAGYAVGSANVRLSTIKTYAALAFSSGVIPIDEHAQIRTVKSYTPKEGRRVDAQRSKTRIGAKKADTIVLSAEQVAALRRQPLTAQGLRDRVLVALLLDLGLRCGEAALITVEDIDLRRSTLAVRRPKVSLEQTHRLSPSLLRLLERYLAEIGLGTGLLLVQTHKSGAVIGQGMSERAITKRIAVLGRAIGVPALSAHDLRHTWATRAAAAGTPIERLKDAGGWTSLAMPARYIQAAAIANDGVFFSDDHGDDL